MHTTQNQHTQNWSQV